MRQRDQNTGYSPTFYPGVREVSQASLLEAAPGGELRSIDIQLRAVGLHSISGKVVGLSGQPVANVYITAGTADGFANCGPQITDTFTIHNLVPGRYILNAQEFSGGTSKSARQVVDLGSADLTGVLLTLSAGVDISGTVRTGNDVPEDAEKIQLSLQGDDISFSAAVTAKAGTFAVRSRAARALPPVVDPPKGLYVKSMKLGDRVLPDDQVDLTGAPGPLGIQLASDGGRVQGVVRKRRPRAGGRRGGHHDGGPIVRFLVGHQ